MAKITRQTARLLHAKIAAAAAELGIEGISAEVGTIRFDGHEARLSVTFKTDEVRRIEEDGSAMLLKMAMKANGIESVDLGDYTLVEHKPSAPKFRWIGARKSDGTRFKFTTESVKRMASAI